MATLQKFIETIGLVKRQYLGINKLNIMGDCDCGDCGDCGNCDCGNCGDCGNCDCGNCGGCCGGSQSYSSGYGMGSSYGMGSGYSMGYNSSYGLGYNNGYNSGMWCCDCSCFGDNPKDKSDDKSKKVNKSEKAPFSATMSRELELIF